MRPTIREIVASFGRPFALVPFFVLFYLLGILVSLLEHTVRCFPMTVVTSEKTIAEQVVALPGNCSGVVETEKFMIESAIFNDVDLPPVRDIYLVTLEGDYARWEDLLRLSDAIVEMNPFLKRVADLYVVGRLKLFAASFALGVIVAVLTFPMALPPRTPFRRLDNSAMLFGGALFVLCGVVVFSTVPSVFRGAYLLAVTAGLLFALIFRFLMKRFEHSRTTGKGKRGESD